MKMKYFNILWVRQHSELQGAREGTLCMCVVLMYTWKQPEHKLYRNLSTCMCVPVYSWLFVDVCLIHSIQKHELRSTLVSTF